MFIARAVRARSRLLPFRQTQFFSRYAMLALPRCQTRTGIVRHGNYDSRAGSARLTAYFEWPRNLAANRACRDLHEWNRVSASLLGRV